MNDLKKQIQKRKRKSFVAIILLVVVFIMGGTIAFFSSSIDFTNIFQTATYKTVTTEVFESPSNWTPGETVPKTITTTNEGSVDAMVRISLTEKWVDQEGNDITASMPSDATIINYTNQNEWNLSDGYYYYYKALEPGETTSTFISGVTLNPNLGNVTCTPSADGKTKTCEATNLGTKKKYRLTLKIETAQADKYKEIWDTDYEPPKYTVYNLSDIIYYDPVSDSTCDASTFNLTNVKEGTSTCYKWRVIETNDNQGSSTIKLQLDHNLSSDSWGTTISAGPTTAMTSLSNNTYTWSKLDNLNYTYDSSASATENYGTMTCTDGICSVNNNVIGGSSEKPLKARLMTYEEMLAIVRNEEQASNCTFDASGGTQYVSPYSSATCTGIMGGSPNKTLGWLFENTTDSYRTNSTSNSYGSDNSGYFLLSANPENGYAYGTHAEAGYITNVTSDSTYYGIRPVVIASKDDVTLGNDVPEENVVHTDSNNNPVYHPGDIVYFDPVTTNTCNSSTFDETAVSRWQSFCFKFRVIEVDDSSDKTDITLQLDHNLIVSQNIYADHYINQIASLFNAANGPTSSWTRVPLLNYSYDTTINGHLLGNSYGTFSCTNGSCGVIISNKKTNLSSGSRVRVITPEELDALNVYAGNASTYSKSFYGGGNNPDISLSSNLVWLLENTYSYSVSGSTNNVYGDTSYGYWTMSPIINQSYGHEYWSVYYDSKYRVSGTGTTGYGVRPVITVPKSYVTTE